MARSATVSLAQHPPAASMVTAVVIIVRLASLTGVVVLRHVDYAALVWVVLILLWAWGVPINCVCYARGRARGWWYIGYDGGVAVWD